MGDDIAVLVKKGSLVDRGIKSVEELQALINLVKTDDPKAAATLIQLINRPDAEGRLSSQQLCHGITDPATGCLELLLEAGVKGDLDLHGDVKKGDLEIGELIGKGKAGKVFQGKLKGQIVAIKQFNNPEKIDDKEFRKELSIMSLVREPTKLLPCYGGSSKKGNKFIVTELMETSVYDLIHDKEVEFDERLRLIMCIQIAEAMRYLHSRNIIHRDLKSLNLLINQRFEIKICDFGLSRVIDKNQPMTSNIGTVAWIAPEIFNNKKLYTEKADVYSFAVIMWELLTRDMPFGEAEAFTIPVLVTKGKRPELPKKYPKEFGKLLEKCWNQKSEKRPSFDEIVLRLREQWVDLLKKQPEFAVAVAFKLLKKGDKILFSVLDESTAKGAGYPLHCFWGAS